MIFLAQILLFALIAAFIIGILLFLIFALDLMICGHDLPTSRRTARALVKIISQIKPDAKNFYDLGCGRGTLILTMKKKLPHLVVYGIDNSRIRVFFARLKSLILNRKVKIKREDVLKTDFKNADIIYTYLWYDMMPALEQKLQKELKQGAIVITNTSKFPNWEPMQKIRTYPKLSGTQDFEILFVYLKN